MPIHILHLCHPSHSHVPIAIQPFVGCYKLYSTTHILSFSPPFFWLISASREQHSGSSPGFQATNLDAAFGNQPFCAGTDFDSTTPCPATKCPRLAQICTICRATHDSGPWPSEAIQQSLNDSLSPPIRLFPSSQADPIPEETIPFPRTRKFSCPQLAPLHCTAGPRTCLCRILVLSEQDSKQPTGSQGESSKQTRGRRKREEKQQGAHCHLRSTNSSNHLIHITVGLCRPAATAQSRAVSAP